MTHKNNGKNILNGLIKNVQNFNVKNKKSKSSITYGHIQLQ